MYMVFIVVIAMSMLRVRRPMPKIARVFAPVLIVLVLASATNITAFLQPNGALPAVYSVGGEAIERTVTPNDLIAAHWVARHDRTHVLQSDLFAQLSLDNFGLDERHVLIPSVDPIVVDDKSWVFSSMTNTVEGRARGAVLNGAGTFKFPKWYFTRTRDILYASTTNIVYGDEQEAEHALSPSRLKSTRLSRTGLLR
jgi:hypothetical protein